MEHKKDGAGAAGAEAKAKRLDQIAQQMYKLVKDCKYLTETDKLEQIQAYEVAHLRLNKEIQTTDGRLKLVRCALKYANDEKSQHFEDFATQLIFSDIAKNIGLLRLDREALAADKTKIAPDQPWMHQVVDLETFLGCTADPTISMEPIPGTCMLPGALSNAMNKMSWICQLRCPGIYQWILAMWIEMVHVRKQFKDEDCKILATVIQFPLGLAKTREWNKEKDEGKGRLVYRRWDAETKKFAERRVAGYNIETHTGKTIEPPGGTKEETEVQIGTSNASSEADKQDKELFVAAGRLIVQFL